LEGGSTSVKTRLDIAERGVQEARQAAVRGYFEAGHWLRAALTHPPCRLALALLARRTWEQRRAWLVGRSVARLLALIGSGRSCWLVEAGRLPIL